MKFFKWMFSHKILTILISMAIVSGAILLPSLLFGGFTPFLAVEVLTITAGVGILEGLTFGIHEARIKYLKYREAKNANKIAEQLENNNDKLLTQTKFYKLCKKFTKRRFKLAKLQKKHTKSFSFSTVPLFLGNTKQKSMHYDLAKYNRKLEFLKINGIKENKINKEQKTLEKKINKIVNDPRYIPVENIDESPMNYTKEIVIPYNDIHIRDERFNIHCNSENTLNAFKELVKDEKFSTEHGREYKVTFNSESELKPIIASIVPKEDLIAPTELILLNEIKESYEHDGDSIFPCEIYSVNKKHVKNKKQLNDINEVENYIEEVKNYIEEVKNKKQNKKEKKENLSK